MIDYDWSPMNDRDSLFIYKPYRSGEEEQHKPIYEYAYPESDYPVIRIPFPIFDNDKNYLPDGFYIIAISQDRKSLLLIQSSVLKAKVPIIKLVEKMRTDEELAERSEIVEKYEKYMSRGNQRKAKKYEKDLETFTKREKARMKASIEYDASLAAYVIKYEDAFRSAIGTVKRW